MNRRIPAALCAALFLGGAASAYAQSPPPETFPSYILGSDSASLPLGTGGYVVGVKDGATVKIPAGDFTAGGGTAAGASGDIQTSNGSGGFVALTPASGIAAWLAAPSSSNLLAALTTKTGTGNAVFATSPTLTTPNLGIPSAIDLTNAINLPLASGVTGVLPAVNGGTANSFTAFSGPTTSTKTFTLPNASASILTSNTPVTAAQGGTGQTSYTDGQLLIGNTTTGGLNKATLTAGSNVTITNGNGSITIASSGGSGSPGGTSGQVQVNSSGSFAGRSLGVGLTDDGTSIKPTNVISTQSGTTYTLQATDANTTVHMTNVSPTTITLLAGATMGNGFGVSFQCDAGCTINRAGSDTINGATSLAVAAHQTAALWSDGTAALGAIVLPSVDPSNASNLASGTVPAARGGAGTVSGIMKANGSGTVSAAAAGTDYAAAVPAAIGWVPTVDVNKLVIFTASRAMTVTDIRGTVVNPVGASAAITVYKAPSGTVCSSGTAQHSGTFNANGTAATNQTLTLAGGAANTLAAGDRLCLSTGDSAAFTAGAGNGGITVTLQVQ